MKMQSAFRQYFLPAVIAAAGLSAVLSLKEPLVPNSRARASRADSGERFFLPQGRALYVIVEEQGVYFGQDFVAFDGLDAFIEARVRAMKPDCALVYGTQLARYGYVTTVLTKIRSSLGVPTELRTYPLRVGTRRGPIEVHKHPWEYD